MKNVIHQFLHFLQTFNPMEWEPKTTKKMEIFDLGDGSLSLQEMVNLNVGRRSQNCFFLLTLRQLYRSGMLVSHLVAALASNIFVIISEMMNFYQKYHRILFACHKILYKICPLQYFCRMHHYWGNWKIVGNKIYNTVFIFLVTYTIFSIRVYVLHKNCLEYFLYKIVWKECSLTFFIKTHSFWDNYKNDVLQYSNKMAVQHTWSIELPH